MFPGMSPRELKRMLKRMGIDLEEIKDVDEVIIRLKDKELVIESPTVLLIDAGKQKIFQITGKGYTERARSTVEEKPHIELSEDDILFIMEQTGVSRDLAEKALIKAEGDLAEAILLIREGRI